MADDKKRLNGPIALEVDVTTPDDCALTCPENQMRKIEGLVLAAVIAGLGGCETPPLREAVAPTTVAEEMVWIRTDGQRGAGNPLLQMEYEIDIAACPGAAERSPAAAPCMGQRGYILAPASDAESLLQDFARARSDGAALPTGGPSALSEGAITF